MMLSSCWRQSCETGVYTHAAKSQVVQTAWVVITLLHAKYPHKDRIKKAVKVIMDRQLADGSWAQEQIEGIFNRYVPCSECEIRAKSCVEGILLTHCAFCPPCWIDLCRHTAGTVSMRIAMFDATVEGKSMLTLSLCFDDFAVDRRDFVSQLQV